jgi:hypothetical protein
MTLFQHVSHILRLHRALSTVVAIGSSAVVTGVLVTGAFAQADPCIFPGICNLPIDLYAAVAISPSTRKFGMSWGAHTEKQAEDRALDICKKQGATDCENNDVTWTKNSCIAVATGKGNNSWGVDWDISRARAKAEALAACGGAKHQSCKIRQSECPSDSREQW